MGARMILAKFSLELLGGWVVSGGIGRADAEDDVDASEEASPSDSTSGSYTLAQGPYSSDFKDEEPWYDEDRASFGFH